MNSDEQNNQAELQSFVNAQIEQMVSRVASMLAAEAGASKQVGGDLADLARTSESRREAVRVRRELAMELVLGALLNEHNPDWDPRDPSTCRATLGSEVLKLLN